MTWGWSDGCQWRADFQKQDGEKQMQFESKLAGCPSRPVTLCTDVLWWDRMEHRMQHSLCGVDHLDSVDTRNNEASVVFQGKQLVAITKYSWYSRTESSVSLSPSLSIYVSTWNSPKVLLKYSQRLIIHAAFIKLISTRILKCSPPLPFSSFFSYLPPPWRKKKYLKNGYKITVICF